MQKTKLWILLADAGNARILERDGTFGALAEIHTLTHSHESNREHGSDRPGRGSESSGTARHAYEPHADWHEIQKDNFARELVQILSDAHLNKKFDELYVMAPPKMLGLIRQHITRTNNHIASKLSKEVNKDAISLTIREIEGFIESL